MIKVSKKHIKNRIIRASMTVEAAFALPLFIFCLINLLFGIQVIETSSRITAAMHETGNEICSYGYAIENGISNSGFTQTASTVYAAASVAKHLGNVVDKRGGIKNGIVGISYLGSSIMSDSNIVKISASYGLKFPVNMGIKSYRLGSIYYGHAWTGYEPIGLSQDKYEEDPTVYITPTGMVYHTDIHCSHLNPSIKAIDKSMVDNLRSKDGAIYYSCEKCGSDFQVGTVYITDYGNRFHCDINCSGIKRNVSAIHLSEVGGRRSCATCGG